MAATAIAFEAPPTQRALSPSQSRPIDLVHLARQTMGDKTLEVEILQIFARQARKAMLEMSSGESSVIIAVAHRLKGAASSVGAFTVADLAMRIEEKGAEATSMAKIATAIVETENFILKLCR
ncbi:Hpt domain-containing protein [Pseudorhizobium flavum]|jgi:HPt (histidine-containing phosphotransfer) domain-containing protein|uniref:HPt (Histidine-containing phosphotransfer) domain-containing protein n=1 Tax=Pseudorhizobium flavum TaxID=1335061 RepID=A0A7X0DCC9_9HYPH|nr:Hpt domain-containing protein [Pseudorhizobium flavum]MBB6178851.1 HPt (histidine-containing phosphotransfer) domain-containing protein [Pseudorhizobium flavum]CAD6607251.1 transcriptional regulator [Pseudorhizobium flavum]